MSNANIKRLSFLFTCFASALFFASPVNSADLTNAKHKVLWSSATSKMSGSTRYIQGKNFRTKVLADYKSVADLRRNYVVHSGFVHFFPPGHALFGGGHKQVGLLDPSLKGSTPSTNLRFNFDFRSLCGQQGGLTTVITLKHKHRNEYINLHQGGRATPHAGGIDPVAIDCHKPRLVQIGHQSPRSFNHLCLTNLTTGKRSSEIPFEIIDDTGISRITIHSDNSALEVTPRQLSARNLNESKDGDNKKYSAKFLIKAKNSQPVNDIKLLLDITDLSGQQQKYTHQLNLSGTGENAVKVNLKSIKTSISKGEKIFFGGNIDTTDCDLKSNTQIQWTIHKVKSRTNTQTIGRVKSGQLKLKGKRTPFIIPFSNDAAGFYQLQMLHVSKNTIIYKSPVIEVMHQLSKKAATQLKSGTQRPAGKTIQSPGSFKLK